MSQISLKNPFRKVFFFFFFFQIFAEIEKTLNENRLFGCHFETVIFFWIFFFAWKFLFLVYKYKV